MTVAYSSFELIHYYLVSEYVIIPTLIPIRLHMLSACLWIYRNLESDSEMMLYV